GTRRPAKRGAGCSKPGTAYSKPLHGVSPRCSYFLLVATVSRRACPGCQHCMPQPGEMIGHTDGIAFMEFGEILIEIKSTQFFRGKAPTEPSAHYIEQAATYGVAIDAVGVCIIVVDRNTGDFRVFWLELD